MPQRKPIRIGTRGSRLALTQAGIVRDLLAREGHESEIVVVKTSGDRIQDRPLADAGGKGLFTKELEEALYADEADIAVHSMKDVPAHLPNGLMLGAFLPREDPRDVLVSNKQYALTSLPPSAIVGTSSVRRRAQLLRARRDVEPVTLRGNVDTRLAKLDAGNFDAVILAFAGLKRLGLKVARQWFSMRPNGCLHLPRAPSASNCAQMMSERVKQSPNSIMSRPPLLWLASAHFSPLSMVLAARLLQRSPHLTAICWNSAEKSLRSTDVNSWKQLSQGISAQMPGKTQPSGAGRLDSLCARERRPG